MKLKITIVNCLVVVSLLMLSTIYADTMATVPSNHGLDKASMPSSMRKQDFSPDQNLPTDKVVLNFENADMVSVIKAISKISGKNFVIDPRVKGTISIVSDKPVSKSDSYKVLASALRMQGFAAVEADGVIKILPEIEAKTYGMKTLGNTIGVINKKNTGDQVITKVFVIQHSSATQLSNTLRPLIDPNNSISAYPNSNALVVTDYASNVERIGKIIEQLTTQSETQQPMAVINFKHAVAADVLPVLQNFAQSNGFGGGTTSNSGSSDGQNVSITLQNSTNSIILYSFNAERLKTLQNIALDMDKTIGANNNYLHVVYLKNADAAHIAEVLRVVVDAQENPDMTATASSSKFSTEPSGIFQSAGSSGSSGSSVTSNGTSSRGNTRSATTSNNSNSKDQPKIFVQAEPTTNSLIIEAPEAVYRNLRMIIDMLDVRRAQVMIEAMIADINATNQGAFGIQWLVGGGSNNAGAIAIANYGGSINGGPSSALSSLATSAIGATSAASGNGGATTGGISIPNEVYVGLVTGTTTIGGQTVPTLGALADMISATSAGNILSRPTLITLDNEEARILVGSNVGIPNGSFQNSANSAGNLVTTITRQDLGTFLQIKPKIIQNGSIQLDIYQEDSKLDPNQPANSTNGPSFLKRNMRATVLVDDGQIIALGGMTSDMITIQQNGIPILSSIPYLGWLFSWQSRYHQKTNLVLFLRPVIIKNADGYKALTNQRYRYVLDQQNAVQAKGNILLPTINAVNLDNQVSYDNRIPQQQSTPVNIPLVDVRGKNLDQQSPTSSSSAVSTNNGSTLSPTIIPYNSSK